MEALKECGEQVARDGALQLAVDTGMAVVKAGYSSATWAALNLLLGGLDLDAEEPGDDGNNQERVQRTLEAVCRLFAEAAAVAVAASTYYQIRDLMAHLRRSAPTIGALQLYITLPFADTPHGRQVGKRGGMGVANSDLGTGQLRALVHLSRGHNIDRKRLQALAWSLDLTYYNFTIAFARAIAAKATAAAVDGDHTMNSITFIPEVSFFDSSYDCFAKQYLVSAHERPGRGPSVLLTADADQLANFGVSHNPSSSPAGPGLQGHVLDLVRSGFVWRLVPGEPILYDLSAFWERRYPASLQPREALIAGLRAMLSTSAGDFVYDRKGLLPAYSAALAAEVAAVQIKGSFDGNLAHKNAQADHRSILEILRHSIERAYSKAGMLVSSAVIDQMARCAVANTVALSAPTSRTSFARLFTSSDDEVAAIVCLTLPSDRAASALHLDADACKDRCERLAREVLFRLFGQQDNRRVHRPGAVPRHRHPVHAGGLPSARGSLRVLQFPELESAALPRLLVPYSRGVHGAIPSDVSIVGKTSADLPPPVGGQGQGKGKGKGRQPLTDAQKRLRRKIKEKNIARRSKRTRAMLEKGKEADRRAGRFKNSRKSVQGRAERWARPR
jgi:hypothetical protein